MPTCSFEAPAQVTHTLVLIILISSAVYNKHPLKGSPALMKKKKKKKQNTRCVTSLNRQPIKKRAVNTGRVQLTYMGLTNPCHIKIRVQVIMHSLIMSTLIGCNLKRTGRRSVSK